jgi:hypothetical protein
MIGHMPPDAQHLAAQVVWLFVLAIPVACCAWTVTHEEVFREPRDFCQERCKACRSLVQRKFFYLFTCEYCFSHYVALFFLALTRYRLLLDDWRGYVLAWFGVVWVANVYMTLFGRLRVEIRSERAEADVRAKEVEVKERQLRDGDGLARRAG